MPTSARERNHDDDDRKTSSKDKLPAAPNPDDPTPLGDTDQHSPEPSEGPVRR